MLLNEGDVRWEVINQGSLKKVVITHTLTGIKIEGEGDDVFIVKENLKKDLKGQLESLQPMND